jgi:hypothetical protein
MRREATSLTRSCFLFAAFTTHGPAWEEPWNVLPCFLRLIRQMGVCPRLAYTGRPA